MQREREAETRAEGEAGSMHREPDVGFDPGSPGSRPGPKAGAKPLRHPGIPTSSPFKENGVTSEVLSQPPQQRGSPHKETISCGNKCLIDVLIQRLAGWQSSWRYRLIEVFIDLLPHISHSRHSSSPFCPKPVNSRCKASSL